MQEWDVSFSDLLQPYMCVYAWIIVCKAKMEQSTPPSACILKSGSILTLKISDSFREKIASFVVKRLTSLRNKGNA